MSAPVAGSGAALALLRASAAAGAGNVIDALAIGSDDESQQWLGCESLHPLTWVPSIVAGAGAGADAAV